MPFKPSSRSLISSSTFAYEFVFKSIVYFNVETIVHFVYSSIADFDLRSYNFWFFMLLGALHHHKLMSVFK